MTVTQRKQNFLGHCTIVLIVIGILALLIVIIWIKERKQMSSYSLAADTNDDK